MSDHNFTPENEKSKIVSKGKKAFPHSEILALLLCQIKKIDFRAKANIGNEKENIKRKHYLVTSIEAIAEVAQKNDWGICQNNGSIYLFNGAFWSLVANEELQKFLGEAAEKLGVDPFDARVYYFRESLFKQFQSHGNLPTPNPPGDKVLVNLLNGTFEMSLEHQFLRKSVRKDFLTYQLPFNYDQRALFPKFQSYLNQVLPDISLQRILQEYIAYLFVSPKNLKLEKTLLLYGSGANGKSVFFEIVSALLGENNVSSFSLQSLTNESGYYRAKLANKLVNYSSEINGKLEASLFKQLVSGEPVEARLPYGQPFTLSVYAKLIFNCNELPKDVEHSNAFFRRFLIVPFSVTIPEAEQDKELAKRIINTELSGIFNWVLEGMQRLLTQKRFTESPIVDSLIEDYKKQSDSVHMFLDENNFTKSIYESRTLKNVYSDYQTYCRDSGCFPCQIRTFSERLRNLGYLLERKSPGMVVYIEKKVI